MAWSDFKDGTLICLFSTLTSPPSPVGPWHGSQCLAKLARAVASGSGVAVAAGAAGEAAVREVLVFTDGAVSVHAETTRAMTTHNRANEISFIRQSLRIELLLQGARSIAVTSSTSQSTRQYLASALH